MERLRTSQAAALAHPKHNEGARAKRMGRRTPAKATGLAGALLGLSLALTACATLPAREALRKTQQGSGRCVGDQSPTADYRIVGVVPQADSAETLECWLPLLRALGIRTQQCYRLELAATIPEFEKRIKEGRYDYAYMNPFHQVLSKANYEPLIRSSKTKLTGVLVGSAEKADLPLSDLNGLKLYLPAPNAFGASLLIQAALKQAGATVDVRYVRTHANTYKAVAEDPKSVGGMIRKTFQQAQSKSKPDKRLRVLYETDAYAPHPFSGNRELSSQERLKVQSAFLALSDLPELKTILEKARLQSPGRASYPKDYQPIEKLKLETFTCPKESASP